MRKILKVILFHEVLMLLMAAGLTAIIAVIYREYDQINRLFLFWFAVLQFNVVFRAVRARNHRHQEYS
jgi:hypothetical protein